MMVSTGTTADTPRRNLPSNSVRRSGAAREKRRRNLIALTFIAPAFVLFLLFFVGPGVLGFIYSFTNYRGYGELESVGFDNYRGLFTDATFYRSLGRTFIYAAASVVTGYFLSLLVSALLVSKNAKGAAVAQVIFFFPWLVSPIVTGVIWRWLFGEHFGLINYLISGLGFDPLNWSQNANLALVVMILAGSWGGTAFSMLLFMSAIRNIPTSYLEAAEIDGAGPVTRFVRIVWPLLAPTSFMVILLGTINAMKEFAMVQALNNGGPGTSNVLMVQYVYETGFNRSNIGYASAASIILMLILLIIALVQSRFDRSDLQ